MSLHKLVIRFNVNWLFVVWKGYKTLKKSKRSELFFFMPKINEN